LKPFFFGDSSRPLFGVHHPAAGDRGPRRLGVVVCHPFGQEYLRSHRSLRELAGRLASAGFHVLRFDLSCCGDSAGEGVDARLEQWLEDVATAAEELRETTRGAGVALVGLRLGGSLAALHAARSRSAEALVLWDPVVRGDAYLREIRASHGAWMSEHSRRPGTPSSGEVLGFPLPEELAASLESLDLEGVDASSAPRTLVVSSSPSRRGPTLWEGAPDGVVDRATFDPAPVWLHAEGMSRVLVPGALLDHVSRWLEGVCA
jgi:alpha-beta hydrolase superfamily lysophospholipase